MISAVVLAAVGARQNGASNIPAGNPPALQAVLEHALHSELDEVICVVRGLALLRPQIALVDKKLFWLVDYGADRGKSHSMIAGLWTVHPESTGVLFLSEDQPAAPKQLIDALIIGLESSNAWIVAPSVAAKTSRPLLFRRELFPELLKLSGDLEGLELIDKFRSQTAFIEWPDHGPASNRAAQRQLHKAMD